MSTWLLIALFAGNWPSWRGPDSNGIAAESQAPMHWTRTENVKWRAELPAAGNSTPVVWGDNVFVTHPDKNERVLVCLDRATGKVRWRAKVAWDAPESTHPTNPYASASPVTDGERVVVWFGSAGLYAYDLKGNVLWKADLGIQKHTWGYGTSPVIAGDRVFLNFGPGERAFLIALDKRTGRKLWQVDVPSGRGAKFANWQPEDMYGSWSTPLAANGEILVSHPRRLVAYDAASGKVNWESDGLGDLVYPSPIIGATESGDRAIFAGSGFGGPMMMVKPGGARFWRQEKSKNTIGSPVFRNGYLYSIDNTGIAQCLNVSTGEVMWTARLPRAGEDNGVWSSPLLVGERIYIMNKSGGVTVFKADHRQFEALATNALEEPSNSSVVLADGELFLRTHQALWCIRRTP